MATTVQCSADDAILYSQSIVWATCRNTGANLAVYRTIYLAIGCGHTTDYALSRSFVDFDLSGINPASTITSATFRVKCLGKGASFSNLYVTSGTQSLPVVTTDWPNHATTTDYSGVVPSASFTAGAWTDITLNAAGLAAAQTAFGGTFKMCIRHEKDFDDSPPLGIVTTDSIQLESDDTGYPSELILDYTPPPGFSVRSYGYIFD